MFSHREASRCRLSGFKFLSPSAAKSVVEPNDTSRYLSQNSKQVLKSTNRYKKVQESTEKFPSSLRPSLTQTTDVLSSATLRSRPHLCVKPRKTIRVH